MPTHFCLYSLKQLLRQIYANLLHASKYLKNIFFACKRFFINCDEYYLENNDIVFEILQKKKEQAYVLLTNQGDNNLFN